MAPRGSPVFSLPFSGEEMKSHWLAQGHTTTEWQNRGLKPQVCCSFSTLSESPSLSFPKTLGNSKQKYFSPERFSSAGMSWSVRGTQET